MKKIILSIAVVTSMFIAILAHAECTNGPENATGCGNETDIVAECADPAGQCNLTVASPRDFVRSSQSSQKDTLNAIAKVNAALGKVNQAPGGPAQTEDTDQ